MKSQTQVERELELLQEDLKFWRAKYDKEKDAGRRGLVANTLIGIESQIQTLQWILKE